ncbi:MAG: hypothetical protein WEA04_02635 [Candidatus Andersenbacteria bacterium]
MPVLKLPLVALVMMISLAVTPLVASAATFLLDEDAISPTAAIEDDVYVAGNEVLLEQLINGDLIGVGQNVMVAGQISEDVIIAGNTLQLRGIVDDDIIAAGNTITVASGGSDDLFLAGNHITVTPEAIVNGDAYLAGQRIQLGGTFRGDVRLRGQQVVVAAGTSIAGDLLSYGGVEPTIEEGVSIAGQTRHHFTDDVQASRRVAIMAWIRSVVMWFVAALLALYLLPSFTRQVIQIAGQQSGAAIGLGLLAIALLVPISIFLIITVIGIPLMALLLSIILTLLVAALIYANILVTALVIRRITPTKTALTWHHLLLGTVIYKTLQFIPIIGFFVAAIVTVWALGTLALVLGKRLHG